MNSRTWSFPSIESYTAPLRLLTPSYLRAHQQLESCRTELIVDSKNDNHRQDQRCGIACAAPAKMQRIVTRDKDPIEVVSPDDYVAAMWRDAQSAVTRPALCAGSISLLEGSLQTMIAHTEFDAIIHT
jgi:hypothetical protein